MSYELVIKERVAEQLNEAVEWYEEREPGIGTRLINEFQEVIRKVSEAPLLYPLVRKRPSIRRVLFPHFPYKILFTLSNQKIVVIRLIHTARIGS